MKRLILITATVSLLAVPIGLGLPSAKAKGKGKKDDKPIDTAIACALAGMQSSAFTGMTATELADYCVELANEIDSAYP